MLKPCYPIIFRFALKNKQTKKPPKKQNKNLNTSHVVFWLGSSYLVAFLTDLCVFLVFLFFQNSIQHCWSMKKRKEKTPKTNEQKKQQNKTKNTTILSTFSKLTVHNTSSQLSQEPGLLWSVCRSFTRLRQRQTTIHPHIHTYSHVS